MHPSVPLALIIEMDPVVLLWLALVGVVVGYLAHRREVKPWLWGPVAVAITFVCLFLMPGLIAVLVGAVIGSVVVYAVSQ